MDRMEIIEQEQRDAKEKERLDRRTNREKIIEEEARERKKEREKTK